MGKKLKMILCVVTIICIASTGAAYGKAVKAKSVSLNIKSVTIAKGSTVTLKAAQKPSKAKEKLIWSSSNKTVATVSKGGVVKAKSEGTATITVKTKKSKKKAKCTVKVEAYTTKKEVTSLIKKNSLSTDDVNALINKKTYTKAEVDSMISALQSNGSYSNGGDFVDGVELKPYEGAFSLPYRFSKFGIDITINSISIKKYHNKAFDGNNYSPYKYVYTIKGKISNIPENQYAIITVRMMDNNKSGTDQIAGHAYSGSSSFETNSVVDGSRNNNAYYYLESISTDTVNPPSHDE